MKSFDYTVNDEPQSTVEHVLDALKILVSAGYDAALNYLVLLEGNHQVSYKDDPSKAIHMHEHMKFLAVSMAPTPVS